MSGDAANSNDDELLSQIDELKARMDRLMKGGTSTSNSALLTDPPKGAAASIAGTKPAPAPPPPRSRVRDLIGPDDSSPIAAEPPKAVSFPDDRAADETRPSDKPTEDRTSSGPPSKPKPAVEGSLISVDDDRQEPRPRVSSFDDLGTAIESELAKDASVPPAVERKGPDLASRFGAAAEDVVKEPDTQAVAETDEEADAEPEPPKPVEPVAASVPTKSGRRPVGAVVAIWVFTAVASGTLAALHFSGII